MCGETIIYVSAGVESVRGVLEQLLGLRRLSSCSGEDGRPYLEYAIHEGNGSVVRRGVWVGFVGFVCQFCAANAPFLCHIAMIGHYLEECMYEVVCCVR